MVVQDATLCSGTLRDNLDITGTKHDHEVFEALRKVHLLPDSLPEEDSQDNLFANLDTFVAIGLSSEGCNEQSADLTMQRVPTSVRDKSSCFV